MAQREDLHRVYARVFGTEEGKKVMEDLCSQFYDVPIYPEADYRAGRHDVVLYVIEQTKRGQTSE